MQPERLLNEKTIFAGHVVTLGVQTVQLPDGTMATREVAHTTGSAGVLALDGERALFVKQWRAPLSQFTLELPAGRLEVDEAPLKTAKRELNEEAGLAAAHWQPLVQFYQAAGFSDAQCHLFLASELSALVEKRPQDIGESVDHLWLTLAEAQAQQQSGVICDAKTVLGLALWANMKGNPDGR